MKKWVYRSLGFIVLCSFNFFIYHLTTVYLPLERAWINLAIMVGVIVGAINIIAIDWFRDWEENNAKNPWENLDSDYCTCGTSPTVSTLVYYEGTNRNKIKCASCWKEKF